MKQISIWQKSVAVPTLLSLTVAIFTCVSPAASTATSQEIEPSALERTSLNKDLYQLAQISESCRKIAARDGAYVREQPTVYSTAIGIIPGGLNVSIEDGETERWTRISAPLKGYVFTDYLSSCQLPPPPTNCRQVSAKGGIYIRQEPSANSAIVGIVPSGWNVTIDNQSANGWLPISVPLPGYVPTDYLTYCS